MQTFFPENNIRHSAMMLDNKRLNKQILEGYQILKVLSTDGKAWRNHPAVLMWEGHEFSLRTYVRTMAAEAKQRGIKVDKNLANLDALEKQYGHRWGSGKPAWFGGLALPRVLATHKARLYAKDPIFYAEYEYAVKDKNNKPCCDKCLYYWPTHALRNAKSAAAVENNV